MRGLREGLGFEEVVAISGVNLPAQSQFLTGSLIVAGTVSTSSALSATSFSGTNVFASTTVQANTVRADTTFSGATTALGNAVVTGSADIPTVYDNTGSPYLKGNVYTAFTTETVVSGGAWVNVSGAAGGASVLASTAIASTVPLGIAVATVGSNTTVDILTRGVAYVRAEATLKNGEAFQAGVGAADNTIAIVASGTAGGIAPARGTVLAGAASGGFALVYLW